MLTKSIYSKDKESSDRDSSDQSKDKIIENLRKQLQDMQKEIDQKNCELKPNSNNLLNLLCNVIY